MFDIAKQKDENMFRAKILFPSGFLGSNPSLGVYILFLQGYYCRSYKELEEKYSGFKAFCSVE